MKKSNIDFSVITDEVCCGSPLLRTGQIERANALVERNLKQFSQFKTVVFSCAGCYRTFKVDYPKLTGKPIFKYCAERLFALQMVENLCKAQTITINRL